MFSATEHVGRYVLYYIKHGNVMSSATQNSGRFCLMLHKACEGVYSVLRNVWEGL